MKLLVITLPLTLAASLAWGGTILNTTNNLNPLIAPAATSETIAQLAHRSCGECWADADRAGNHPRGCQRNVPALRFGKSVPGFFENARIQLSAVREGRSASGVTRLDQ